MENLGAVASLILGRRSVEEANDDRNAKRSAQRLRPRLVPAGGTKAEGIVHDLLADAACCCEFTVIAIEFVVNFYSLFMILP